MSAPNKKMRRFEHQGHIRFLTFSCYHRLPLFNNDAIKSAFRDHIHAVKHDHPFRLFAWVIMPEHVHLLLQPIEVSQSIGPLMKRLKSPFARRVIDRWRELDARILNRLVDDNGTAHFWQSGGGYDRNIFSDSEYGNRLSYIHANPVRRGLVVKATDYAWSSARWYEGKTDEHPAMDSLG